MSFSNISKANSIKILAILVVTILAITVPFIMYLANLQKPVQPTGKEVKIGVVDSGCGYLQSNRIIQYESFVNESLGFDINIRDPYDALGHGSQVCKIILDNAPNDTIIYSAKVADNSGKLTYKSLFAAVEWLAESVNVDIINLSLGSIPYVNATLEQKFREYAEKGIIIIAATGNRGDITQWSSGRIEWPASLPWVVGVGAYNINETNFADYSSYGLGLHSGEVVDFVANGNINGKKGTSYATPYITALTAIVIDYKIKHKQSYTYEEIISVLTTSASRYINSTFNEKWGWGQPNATILQQNMPNLLQTIPNKVILNGGKKIDFLPRFANENYSFYLQAFSPANKLQATDFIIKGNGSDFASVNIADSGTWGDLLQIRIQIPLTATVGAYNISIATAKSNTFTYSFEVSGNYSKTLLLDNSQSINAYNFQFGDMSKLDYLMRLYDYYPKFTQNLQSVEDMQAYNAVILLEPGYSEFSHFDMNFTRFNVSNYQIYNEYVATGGNMLVLGNTIDEYTSSQLNQLVNPWGVNITANIPITTDNFILNANFSSVPEVTAINQNITQIKFKGANAVPINETGSVYSLGWYTHKVAEPIGTSYEYYSFGAAGTYKNGSFIVFNNYDAYSNINFVFDEIFEDNDIYFLHLLSWLTTN